MVLDPFVVLLGGAFIGVLGLAGIGLALRRTGLVVAAAATALVAIAGFVFTTVALS